MPALAFPTARDGSWPKLSTKPNIGRPEPDFVQQSSTDIWQAVCASVREVLTKAGIDSADVEGLGFDATCSLVVLDAEDRPVSVSPNGEADQNIIMWMDHRATTEAEEINTQGHEVLRYVGGRISPEMQTPKILWLKRHLPEAYEKAANFFDLPDYLTFRATDDRSRSLCSTVCKMTYLGHEAADQEDTVGRWDTSYFEQIGLEDFVTDDFVRLGQRVRPVSEALGNGLTEEAATDLGLKSGTAVSVSLIDAHAGGVGMLGLSLNDEEKVDFDKRIALIGGTSSCHMAVSSKARFIDGIWGPYYSAMVPNLWLSEGGQSAVGSLIDHLIFGHKASTKMRAAAKAEGLSPYAWLNQRVTHLTEGMNLPAELAKDLHVDPDFHGNRSPRADASLKGTILGMGMSATVDDLVKLYLATVDALAYGTRQIIECMNTQGYQIETIIMCGGHIKNELFLQEHADVTSCRIVIPSEPESVLLGSAMLGAVAAGKYPDIPAAMAAMSQPGKIINPNTQAKDFHDRKYEAFHKMHELQIELRN